MSRSYHAILFDLDGTLLSSSHIWDTATRKAVANHHINFTEEEFLSLASVLIHDLLAEKGYDQQTITSVRAARDANMKEVIQEELQWFPGAREMLENLKTRYELGIVTSVHLNIFTSFDVTLGIRDLVDTVILADDVKPNYKPAPDGLLLACKHLDVDPTQCIYVGDQECDMLAAKNAGMDFILMKGPRTPNAIKCEKMASTPADVLAWL